MSRTDIIAISTPVQYIEAQAATEQAPAKLPGFTMEPYNGDALPQPWSDVPIVIDLEGMEIAAELPVFLNHDRGQAVGHTTKVEIKNGKKLIAAGVVSRATPAAAEVVAAGKNGYPWQSSVWASIHTRELVPSGKSAKANGKTWHGPVLIARKTTLQEISFVDMGAANNTSATIAAAAAAPGSIHPQKGGSSMDLKTRKQALLAAHPQHESLILAALVDGAEDADIKAQVAAAEQAAIVAERDRLGTQVQSITQERDQARTELAEVKAQLAAKDQQIAALNAKLGLPPVPAGSGSGSGNGTGEGDGSDDTGTPPTATQAQVQAMAPRARARFYRLKGVISG